MSRRQPPAVSSERRYDTVTLLSDYGSVDGFVGVVHSVIRQLCPGVGLVDLTHDITPFDVRGGSLVLARAVQYLCPGVIMAVVDPGVGTARHRIAVEVAGGRAVLVGPDNGLLAPAIGMIGGAERAVVLDEADYHLPSGATTFDGRDVFAPVAGHLCAGVPLTELGTEIDPVRLMPGVIPLTRTDEGRLIAEVLWIDRFGNCQLNVDPGEIDGWGDAISVTIDGRRRTASRVRAFAEVPTGALGLLVDADGLLALVTDRDSASVELCLAAGDQVDLSSLEDTRGARADLDAMATAVTTSVHLGRPDRGVGRDAGAT